MPRNVHNLDFARRLMRRSKQHLKGDSLPSTMFGSLSIVIGIVNLAALFGRGPESIPNLVRRATVFLVDDPDQSILGGAKTAPGWWFVPEAGFWVLAASALALAFLGIVLSFRRGRPMTSLVGFGLNTVVAVAGYVLAFTDFRYWG